MSETLPIYVINLERSRVRWDRLSSQLESLGLSPTRIDAVDGMTLDIESFFENTPRIEGQRYLHEGEIACALSHRKALRTFLDSDAKTAVILEDDAVMDAASAEMLPWLSERLLENDGWVMNIGPWNYKFVSEIGRRGGFRALNSHQFALGAYGLLWTRSGAEQMVDRPMNLINGYDHDLRMMLAGKNRGYSVQPPLVTHFDLKDSTITEVGTEFDRQNRDKEKTLSKRIKRKSEMLSEEGTAFWAMLKWKMGRRS